MKIWLSQGVGIFDIDIEYLLGNGTNIESKLQVDKRNDNGKMEDNNIKGRSLKISQLIRGQLITTILSSERCSTWIDQSQFGYIFGHVSGHVQEKIQLKKIVLNDYTRSRGEKRLIWCTLNVGLIW